MNFHSKASMELFNMTLYLVLLVIFVILLIITPYKLYVDNLQIISFLFLLGLLGGFISVFIFQHPVFKRKKGRLVSVLKVSDRYLLLIASLIGFMYFLLFLQGQKLSWQISKTENVTINDILVMFFVPYLSVFIVYYLINNLKAMYFLVSLGLTESYVKNISQRIRTNQIKDRMILAYTVLDTFENGLFMATIFMISNFFEEIIDLFWEKGLVKEEKRLGFKKKVKALELDIKDPLSNLKLSEWYYKIRSKYAHEIYKSGPFPSISEVKVSLGLLKNFLEKLPAFEQRYLYLHSSIC